MGDYNNVYGGVRELDARQKQEEARILQEQQKEAAAAALEDSKRNEAGLVQKKLDAFNRSRGVPYEPTPSAAPAPLAPETMQVMDQKALEEDNVWGGVRQRLQQGIPPTPEERRILSRGAHLNDLNDLEDKMDAAGH